MECLQSHDVLQAAALLRGVIAKASLSMLRCTLAHAYEGSEEGTHRSQRGGWQCHKMTATPCLHVISSALITLRGQDCLRVLGPTLT